MQCDFGKCSGGRCHVLFLAFPLASEVVGLLRHTIASDLASHIFNMFDP